MQTFLSTLLSLIVLLLCGMALVALGWNTVGWCILGLGFLCSLAKMFGFSRR